MPYIPSLQPYLHLLGLNSSATLTDVKREYKKLVLKYHPDKNQNNEQATTDFQALQTAYEKLVRYAENETRIKDDNLYSCEENYNYVSEEDEGDIFGFFAPKSQRKKFILTWKIKHNESTICLSHPIFFGCSSDEIIFWYINTSKASLVLPINNNLALKKKLKCSLYQALGPQLIVSCDDDIEMAIKLPQSQSDLTKILRILAINYEIPASVLTFLSEKLNCEDVYSLNNRLPGTSIFV
ncbi:hypothetical protein B1207_14075 [Legionella quinlivanii]|uniref:J domain-containing protein n=1 Tax=Legionella quinlivanii TaxID=45073 RepID=A0A364LFZ2_9GAMM|nr:J domain-containing protein [Legionella quinlivanii]RAP35022.1 hypothetical protein B1207_14075 [Legionella quinlivanii]